MLMFHGTPLGGKSIGKQKFLNSRNALVSYMHQQDLKMVQECSSSYILDNGAFTAWNSGSPIKDWRLYYLWCKSQIRHPRLLWCLIPDIIDGTELENDIEIANWLNWVGWKTKQAELSRWFLNERSVPIWHLHESIDRLVRLAKSWSWVAFGSSGEFSKVGDKKWHKRIQEAFEAITIEKQPICKVHGLRMANPAVFHRYPFSSVDSTNVAQNAQRDAKKWGVSIDVAREIVANRSSIHNSAQVYIKQEVELVYTNLND